MNTQSKIHPIAGDAAQLASELHMRWIFDVLATCGVSYAEIVPHLDAAGIPKSPQLWAEFLWSRANLEIVLIAETGATSIYKSENSARTLIAVWEKPAELVKQGSRSGSGRFLLVRHT